MNCHDIDRLLIAGTDPSAWPAEARAHAESCTRCQDLLGLDLIDLSGQRGSALSAVAPNGVTQAVLSDLQRVTPLIGNTAFTLILITGVMAAMAALLIIVGAKGFPVMSDLQRITFGVVLIGMLWVTATSYAKQLIPGSLISIPSRQVMAVFSALFACLVVWQFHRSYAIPMAHANLQCYECGVLGAGLTFAVGWWSGKRGFWSGNRTAIEALCLLSAAAALLMLTIHCPLQNAGHVFIGHGGAFLTAICAGWAARWYQSR